MSGTIRITNQASIDQAFTVNDVFDDGTIPVVTCPSLIAPAKSGGMDGVIECTYTTEDLLQGQTATLNTATVTAAGNPDQTATAHVGEYQETLEGVDDGTLKDERFNFEETVNGDSQKTFSETLQCPSNSDDYTDGVHSFTETNTADLIVDENLSDSASVYVTCYVPIVSKDAAASYDERHGT